MGKDGESQHRVSKAVEVDILGLSLLLEVVVEVTRVVGGVTLAIRGQTEDGNAVRDLLQSTQVVLFPRKVGHT